MKLLKIQKGAVLALTAISASTLVFSAYGSVNPVQTEGAVQVKTEKEKKSKHRDEVKRVIDEVVTIKGVPSVIAGGLQNGKRWSYATGTASYEVPHPVESNFSFRIGSISKTFTASVVLQLADEKKLNLDDSVEKWLPGVIKGEGYDGNKITIRQLLNLDDSVEK
ncbi:CubicO group peptidase (beta-lactamase class C family) [Bacillus sp. RC242]